MPILVMLRITLIDMIDPIGIVLLIHFITS